MRLFGREHDNEEAVRQDDAVAAFWAWWQESRPRVEALVAAGDKEGLAELLAPAVGAVHPGLVWEVAPGRSAVNALVVTAAGDAELRPLAHRWAGAAPAADLMWEFHPSRRPDPQPAGLSLDVGGFTFGLDKLVLGLRVPRGSDRVDVSAYHPIFSELDEETRTEATLLALDRILGEDEVARWVGEITPATAAPIDAVAAAYLPAVVADVASGAGEDQWLLLEGQTGDGAPLVAAARHPLRPVDHPLLDQHVMITLPYAHHDADGLPAGASEEALRAFDERLGALLAPRDDALLAAHLSAQGHRVVHVYADSRSDAAARVGELAARWKEGKAVVDVEADPAWAAVSAFMS
ncbi:DUF695 domain-containing protein [Nonomuraea pusilla]|uniref:DUF695 domain-containing protein n=1 Tax=Nonomuraea pusilla TaxID=46177 RepID=A0A1H8C1D7_9ACTN|nr:DUF695 domain-containing protein [Nonomuraea pusilla]SEM88679.1 Family of unknown function [Nonomuraea pusilla]